MSSLRAIREQLLLESIRLENGHFPLLDYHQERLERSRKLLFPKAPLIRLQTVLEAADLPSEGVYKVRVLYAEHIEEMEHTPYTIKPVTSLQLVDGNQLRYAKKYANRVLINQLLANRGLCDDIVIVQHGFLTDASYANIALFDGSSWYTPASPLLRGTRRAKLLAEGLVKTAVIREKDLIHFSQLRLINSMIPWEEAPSVPVAQIKAML